MAQQVSYRQVNTSVNDNGTDELAIRVSAERADGQRMQYSRTFDVRGLNKTQREALKNHVLDSLGVGNTPPPPGPPTPPTVVTTPLPPTPAAPMTAPTGTEVVRLVCPSCTDQMRLEISGTGYTYSRSHSSDKEKASIFPLELSMAPGDYRLMYWQNKVLQMQTPFTVKAGEKNVITVK